MTGAVRYVVVPIAPLESADVVGKPTAPPPRDMAPRAVDRKLVKKRRKQAARNRRKR